MRGGYIHNEILAKPIIAVARELGLTILKEAPVIEDGRTCAGDILVESASLRVLIEIETSAKRIERDLAKSESLNAELWIVVPSRSVFGSVRRKLQQLSHNEAGTSLLLVSEAVCGLERRFPRNSESNRKEKRNQ